MALILTVLRPRRNGVPSRSQVDAERRVEKVRTDPLLDRQWPGLLILSNSTE
ncbi:hypothetical protein [Streptomyces sp. NBC_00019]|uniref:hypothetical protein n=1 Tax=Streptomyces sp. NBC_00019 TaxID=2975623 RepID=UPI0032479591